MLEYNLYQNVLHLVHWEMLYICQSTSCVIGGDCYSTGQLNPDDEEEFCDPEQAEYGWSKSAQKANGNYTFLMAPLKRPIKASSYTSY